MNDFTESTTTTHAGAEDYMSEEFRRCLKQERDRERSRRESAQGMFESLHQSLDRLFDTFEDPSKAAAFSDGSAGEERIVAGAPSAYSAYLPEAVSRPRVIHLPLVKSG